MRIVKSALWLVVLLLSYASVEAQDPGVRDTVLIEGGPLYVGRSVPLRFRMANDENISAFLSGIVVESADSGFMRLDSVVWVNRMADPSVLVFRADAGLRVDGSAPDSVLFGASILTPPWNTLPPGSDYLALAYFTGISAGKVKLDSASLGNESTFFMYSDCCDIFTPAFVGGVFEIKPDNEPPGVYSIREPVQGAVGDELVFALAIASSGRGGLSVKEASISLIDDSQVSAGSEPVTRLGDSVYVQWAPGFADVGVWEYTVVVCDTAGNCDTATAEFDIVSHEGSLVEFTVREQETDFRWSGLTHGDLDQDGFPEVIATGFGIDGHGNGSTSRLGVFKYDAASGFSLVQREKDGNYNVAPVVGFLDNDDDLDLVTFGPRANERGSELFVRIFAGSFGARFSVRDESLPYIGFPADSKVADVTGDGRLDVIVARATRVSVLSSDSANLLNPFSEFEIPDTAKSVNVADFDGDGDVDLAIGTVANLSVYLNDGVGSFVAGSVYPEMYSAVDIEVTNRGGDFNEDGETDLCVSTPSVGGVASELIIYLSDANGGFVPQVTRTIKGQVIGNTVGDFNGDTHLDVAYVNASRREVGLLLGDGLGEFEDELRYPLGRLTPHRIDCLDIDRDGDLDILVGSSRILAGGSMHVLENKLDPQDISEAGLTISGSGNVALRLKAPNGALLSRARNTLPGAEYYQRNADVGGAINEFLCLSVAQRGAYTLTAVPNTADTSEKLFSLELQADGVRRRLAQDMPMRSEGYSFKLFPSGNSPHVPENGVFVSEALPGFIIATVDSFDIELSTDYTFSSIFDSASVTGNFYSPSISLAASDTALYYWRYRPAGSELWTSPIALNVTAVASPVCGDVDGSGRVNVADIVYGISNMFIAGPPPLDRARGDVDVSGAFDIADAIRMISYVFRNGSAPVCP